MENEGMGGYVCVGDTFVRGMQEVALLISGLIFSETEGPPLVIFLHLYGGVFFWLGFAWRDFSYGITQTSFPTTFPLELPFSFHPPPLIPPNPQNIPPGASLLDSRI